MRFVDSPELFGWGAGKGTSGDIQCEICHTKYNKGADKRGVYDEPSVIWTEFAGMVVCDCCFEKIEEEVWNRRHVIMLWLDKRLEVAYESLEKNRKASKRVLESLKKS